MKSFQTKLLDEEGEGTSMEAVALKVKECFTELLAMVPEGAEDPEDAM